MAGGLFADAVRELHPFYPAHDVRAIAFDTLRLIADLTGYESEAAATIARVARPEPDA
jgi:hypothetical protein